MGKKIATWVAIAFTALYVINQPVQAAGTVNAIVGFLSNAANSAATFFSNLNFNFSSGAPASGVDPFENSRLEDEGDVPVLVEASDSWTFSDPGEVEYREPVRSYSIADDFGLGRDSLSPVIRNS